MSSHPFHVLSVTSSRFRHPVLIWTVLCCVVLPMFPSVSFAQQPTATISALRGMVLVNNQEQKVDAILREGDTLETSEGASVTLQLSDGSIVEVGEKAKLHITTLQQTAAGARVSQVTLSEGGMRAQLSQDHQYEGSSFDIETPNAQIGVTFSQPDVEVSYDVAKAETIALAHTVALSAKNILTDEEKIVPIGAMVIIGSSELKILAGGALTRSLVSKAGESTAETIATESSAAPATAEAGTKTGMGTTTKVVIGVGAAALAAGGIAALALSGEESSESETAESSGDLSGNWVFSGSCEGYGCTAAIDESPGCMGLEMCNCCKVGGVLAVTQTGKQLSGASEFNNILNGTVEGNNVSFTITNFSLVMPLYQATDIFTGTLSGNTITGTLTGFGDVYTSGPDVPMTWDGTFTATINK